jgi:hypothetical protein
MGNIDIVLDKIVCHAMTEWFHDEVYYMGAVARAASQGGVSTSDTGVIVGPTAAQGATSDRGNVQNGAWETNDSDESSLQLSQTLFPVQVADHEDVVVTLTLMESDGDNYADIEARGAAVATGVLGVVTAAFAPASVVTVPAGLALAAVTSAGQIARGFFDNKDDVLGSVSFTLEGVGSAVHVVQVGATGEVTASASEGSPASMTARIKGSGGDYEVTVSVRGAVMAQAVVRTTAGGVHVRDHRGDSGGVVVPHQGTEVENRVGAAGAVVRDHR